MGKLTVFAYVTPDGFFAGPRGEIDWFKSIPKDRKFEAYTHEGASSGNTLLMGRTTYDMMKSYWPTPQAEKDDPKMARAMRESPKIVFSRKLKSVTEGPNWKDVTLRHKIDPAAIRRLKKKTGLTTLGSGSIVRQLAKLGLIDEYDLMLVPIVLGKGKPLFKDFGRSDLELLEARGFGNGVTALRYASA